MVGIKVEEIKTTRISTTDGKELKKGDLIMVGIKGQDVVGTFQEIDKAGYFVIKPVVTSLKPLKYRPASVTACFKVSSLEVDVDEGLQGAAKVAAVEANTDVLAPATE